MNSIPHPTWIEIDRAVIAANMRLVKQMAGVPVMAVVKNDAYGFGMLPCARIAVENGADWLGVVRLHEAKSLREAGFTEPIFVLGGITLDEARLAVELGVKLPIFDPVLAEKLSQTAEGMGRTVNVHFKIDTGLGRFGVFPQDAPAFLRKLLSLPGLNVEGFMSHFAKADEKSHPLTNIQVQRFHDCLQTLRSEGFDPKWIHLASSGAMASRSDVMFNLVRAGGAIFGVGLTEDQQNAGFQRAFSWKAKLQFCKQFPAGWGIGYGQDYITNEGDVIGVLPVGHGDGFLRMPENEVLIDGKRVPVVGMNCMDQTMLLLPKIYPVGTEVVLVGKQGEIEITPEEIGARWKMSATSATEIKQRVPRIYLN